QTVAGSVGGSIPSIHDPRFTFHNSGGLYRILLPNFSFLFHNSAFSPATPPSLQLSTRSSPDDPIRRRTDSPSRKPASEVRSPTSDIRRQLVRTNRSLFPASSLITNHHPLSHLPPDNRSRITDNRANAH